VKNAYNLVKENPLKDKQRSAESLKKAYEGLKGEVEENKAKKIKELVAESDHYFRTGRDRQVAMSISSDKRLDEYEENN